MKDIDSIHAIATISPEESDNSDLRILKELIGNKRIVVLGEDAHQNASGIMAHHRIIKFLNSELGFTRVLFELDMYPLWKAQQCSLTGVAANTIATELSRRLDYYGKEWFDLYKDLLDNRTVKIGGFDIGYDGYFSENISNELKQILDEMREPLTAEDATYYLQFASDAELALTYTKNIYSIDRIENISRLIINDLKSRKTNVWPDIYAQIIQNNIGLLKWANSRTNESLKDLKLFYRERDVQMARNILWWLNAFPDEKFIIHCSNYHAARNLALPKDVRPMIDVLSDSISVGQMYSLANLTYSGIFGYVDENSSGILVPARADASIEKVFHERGFKYLLLDFSESNLSDNSWFIIDSNVPLIERGQRWTTMYDGVFFIDRAAPFTELKINHEEHVNIIKNLVCQ